MNRYFLPALLCSAPVFSFSAARAQAAARPATDSAIVAPSAARSQVELSFHHVEVEEVLDQISRKFDVTIIMSSDLRGIILSALNLRVETPDAAIAALAKAADVKYRKQANGTFLIAKTLSDDAANPIAPATKNEAASTNATTVAAKTSFKAATLFSPSQISLKTLPNGVRGIVKSAVGSDLVSVQIWVRAGSRAETDKESGAAHLIELLALRGSKEFPAGTNDDGGALDAIRALGGDGGSLASRDSTFYSATVAAPFAERAIGIMADAVLHPDLSLAAIEDAKVQANDDVARRSFDPVSGASDLAYATAFSKHPYRRAAIGSENAVGALNQKTARAFYQKQYVGRNISVVVVGQIDPVRAQAIIARAFASASPRAATLPKVIDEGPLKLDVVARRRLVLREVIDLGWRSPGIDKPDDCVALDMILSLWREGLDANLRRVLLRDGDKGPLAPLVASYDVDYLTQKDAGLFLVSLVDPQDREAAVDAILGEVKKLRDGGVSESEMQRARAQLRDQYIDQGATVSGQAGALGFYDTIASYRFAVDYLDRCSKVSAADLQRVARKYLTPDRYIRTEISPLPRPRPEEDNGAGGPTITVKWSARPAARFFVR